MIGKILIANRGEIACRVIRTATQLGLRTVAVYSDADRRAQHVQLADEAVYVGAAPARDSYLDADKILAAATATGCDAVHPGYGFLSENADFARACANAGLLFVGPPAEAIEAMGSKSAAKTLMQEAGVPLVPGYHGAQQDNHILQSHADRMGYPVLLKAAAGGGGKGMRVVERADDFLPACEAARREAAAGFGDDTLLVEKYLLQPRHVEIQVFCDNHGNSVYLGERDCSLQRRHQKVIEEAPAPGLSVELRRAMGEAAVRCAGAIGYRGAGTVEFLLDRDGSFYFMEMNTRLQVEHPVTEMITDQDLVAWQLAVVAGEPLPLSQEQIRLDGHAFEARIYAEDPQNDFLPATGRITHLRCPPCGHGVRIDSGVCEGDDISVYYDPMIAKLIVHGPDRASALGKLRRALSHYCITGLPTNRDFLLRCAAHPDFAEAQIDTGFIPRHLNSLLAPAEQAALPALAAACVFTRQRAQALQTLTPWQCGDDWRLAGHYSRTLELQCGDHLHSITVSRQRDSNALNLQHGDTRLTAEVALNGDQARVRLDGHDLQLTLLEDAGSYTLFSGESSLHFRLVDHGDHSDTEADDHGSLTAPMNGTVIALLAEPGQTVSRGTPLLVMEAMKMEHTLNAPSDGRIDGFYAGVGDLVSGGSELIRFEETVE
ncbi:acetyl/propionyl/methylcrotonyl-CoA carboxylase subunit alpha [Granulosicoccaceae sp. 1_MG-2023]|nr:acetyl/propionyl/methylcrotonyl-CoA carboxylase subunit alpha [Granulosicoccaceae sp. 1_MG-2023]